MQHRRIFLVGPMGAGKTTIGKRLARELGLSFLDSDQEIEARTGVDIPRIFDIEGEEGFRQREQRMIDELSARDGIVLATGGGAVLSGENRRMLGDRGVVVYLQTSVAEQLRRTRRDRNRPLLMTDDREARLETLMARRAPLYQEIAAITVDTGEAPVTEMVRRIIGQLNRMEDTP